MTLPLKDSLQPVPDGVSAYVDQMRIWVRQPLTKKELRALEKSAAQIIVNPSGVAIPPRFDRGLRQHLRIMRPTVQTIRMLMAHGAYVNYVEIALDLMFGIEHDLDRVAKYFDRTFYKKYHRDQVVKYVHKTRYTARRGAPNNVVSYFDQPSKITGEPCYHIEWRLHGTGALRRAGISQLGDLLTLDGRDFWKDRLILIRFDARRLGRAYHRWWTGSRRRKERVIRHGKFAYYPDSSVGTKIYIHQTAQAVVKEWGAPSRLGNALRRCIIRIDNSGLLPAAGPILREGMV